MQWQASVRQDDSPDDGAERCRVAGSLADTIIDQGPDALVVIGRRGEFVYANARARQYAETRFLLEFDSESYLRFLAPKAQEAFRRALPCLEDESAGVALFDLHADCTPHCQVSVAAMTAPQARDLLIVRIRNLAEACAAKIHHATVHFRLSPAESRVLQGALNGLTPAACAAGTGLKISTVRTHLASLFAKTQTQGQVQLIVKIMSLPEA